MARRYLPAHRFVCLTDRASCLPRDLETLPITAPHRAYGWWAKIHLFNPALPLSGRLLYFDLDVLLARNLEEVVTFPAPLAFAPNGGTFQPRNGLRCVKLFNSSVIVWDHGTHPELFTTWTPEVTRRLWGDQDWFGEQAPRAAAMPASWFPRLSEVGTGPPWHEDAKVLLCKKPKNVEAATQFPWFAEAWQ
jgi:hypothetical protein